MPPPRADSPAESRESGVPSSLNTAGVYARWLWAITEVLGDMAKARAGTGYREAQGRIAEAKRIEARGLSLSGLGLTTLPPEIASLTALQTLHLDRNQLSTLPPEIASLRKLQTLYLERNRLTTLPSETAFLTALQWLDLGHNQLTMLLPEIASLTALQSLDLRSNQLTTLPPEIASLTALQSLDLRSNQLTSLPPEIGSLTALQTLFLNGNQLTSLPSEIGSLTSLQSLFLNGNQLTSLPPEIGSLTALQSLVLEVNQLTTLPPEIGSLTSLQSLFLNRNHLTTLPPEIVSLTSLQVLELGSNQFTTLPPAIGSLTALQLLDLSNNQLTALPPAIGSLTALQTLFLDDNQITTLPPEIGSLTALQTLNLQRNQLTTLPPEIGSLTALWHLFLYSNQLTTLPPAIGSLTALQELHLVNNQLTTLPPEIASLTALQELSLNDNQLTMLPPEIVELTWLRNLYLHGNPGLGLPPEVLGPTWGEDLVSPEKRRLPSEILEYYFSTAAGARALREVKLILVGRGDVGKSTLADVLQGKPFQKSRPPTEGIRITPWPVDPEGDNAVIRIWDFGGQQIMHGTHQFFLTRRAIYIVMVDGRDDRSQREAEYWLKLVRAFGGNSTVLVVMNRQEHWKFDLDRNALGAKYGVPPDLFFRTECSQEETITPVKQALLQVVADMLSKQENFPAEWWAIKEHLEQMDDDHLSDSAYRALCREHGINAETKQDQLLDRLNDLGTIVHFDDDGLADLKVLNPEWATDGVYRVVTNEKLREEKQGRLKAGSLKDILPRKRWPEAQHRQYILRLMRRFDLCFQAAGEDDVYIVPDLLPEKTPKLADWEARECVVFRYEYPVLPHGILPRFISKTHLLSQGRERWRSGVIVAEDGAEALVRADYDEGVVNIWVRGQHRDARRALLTNIRSRFAEIHHPIKDLDPEEMVGVPLDPTVFEPYRDLILDERDGERTVRVTIAGKRIAVPLDDILTGVESPEERRVAAERALAMSGESKRIVFEAGSIKGDVQVGDDKSIKIGGDVISSQVGQTLTNCTNTINQVAPGEKKDLLNELRAQVEELIKSLPDDKVDEAPEVAENLAMLVKQTTSGKPNQRWYSVSAEGLLEASKWTSDFIGNIAETVGKIGKLLWPDYELPSAG
jgi:internalin A